MMFRMHASGPRVDVSPSHPYPQWDSNPNAGPMVA